MLLKVVASFVVVSICCGFQRDERFKSNENETIVNIFTQTMKISHYKVPQVDNLGEKWRNCCEEKH